MPQCEGLPKHLFSLQPKTHGALREFSTCGVTSLEDHHLSYCKKVPGYLPLKYTVEPSAMWKAIPQPYKKGVVCYLMLQWDPDPASGLLEWVPKLILTEYLEHWGLTMDY